MKVGVLADVHGDIFALDAALPRLRQMGCDPILCAGALIEMEPFGEEVIQRLKSEKGLICIRGNHERWALERRRHSEDVRSFFEPCSICRWWHRAFARGRGLAGHPCPSPTCHPGRRTEGDQGGKRD